MSEGNKEFRITRSFASPVAEYIFRKVPTVRGGAQIGSLLFQLMPFLDRRAFLELRELKCTMSLTYKTHFEFLRRPFEPVESHMVLSILNEGEVFFDIGGNWGYFSFLGSVAVGEQGTVITVEANHETFRKMQRMIVASGLSNVLAFNQAMSNVTGDKVSMSLPWYRMDTGGFIKTDNTKFNVSTKTLDLLWFQVGCPKVKMIKIDTEGAEVMILEGGRRFFTEALTGVAMIEVANWTKRFGHEPIEIYKKMYEFGFNYAYGVSDDKLIKIKMPINELGCFLGNVFFAKTDDTLRELSCRIGEIS